MGNRHAGAAKNGKHAMSGAKHHDYHLVNPSVWPLIGSVAALVMFFGGVMAMHTDYFGGIGKWVLGLGFMGVIATFFSWWSDVINEAHAGDPTPAVPLHRRSGMLLFIAPELMLDRKSTRLNSSH